MNYEKLVERKIIEPCKVSDEEIADHLRVAGQDIKTAQNTKSYDLD